MLEARRKRGRAGIIGFNERSASCGLPAIAAWTGLLAIMQTAWAADCSALIRVVQAGDDGFKSLVDRPLPDDVWASKIEIDGYERCVIRRGEHALSFGCEGKHLQDENVIAEAENESKKLLRTCLSSDWYLISDNPEIGLAVSNGRLIASTIRTRSIDTGAVERAIDEGSCIPGLEAMSGWRVDLWLVPVEVNQPSPE